VAPTEKEERGRRRGRVIGGELGLGVGGDLYNVSQVLYKKNLRIDK
jgi:hypothetical protein